MSCECGCGEVPASGGFRSGHDQKLRINLEQQVGGLLALRDLVRAAAAYSAGEQSLHSFSDQVRRVFAHTRLSNGGS